MKQFAENFGNLSLYDSFEMNIRDGEDDKNNSEKNKKKRRVKQ